VFLVNVTAGRIRLRAERNIGPRKELDLQLPATSSSIETVEAAVRNELINAKLYPKEAQAMINTWKKSWFSEDGTRLFYIVPQRFTDAILPLKVDPWPAETIRVLVGRMEIMPPEEETRLMKVIQESATHRQAAHNNHVSYNSPLELKNLGRLALPALNRILAMRPNDSVVRNEVAALLNELSPMP
jgi:hypothetical protein